MGTGIGAAISDAGPIIPLYEIGVLRFLRLFDSIHVPDAVWEETVGEERVPDSSLNTLGVLRRHQVASAKVQSLVERSGLKHLQPGECECLSLGTRSAKRELQRLSGKQARFQRDTNHTISKRIVSKAKARNSAIVLEDLSGIRERTTVGRQQRARHSNWSFYELRQFIEYKALIAEVPVIKVDPSYTSQTCSSCGHCDSTTRNGSDFGCQECGHSMDADKNAARNIAARAKHAQGCSQ